ncbi:MAG: ATP-binding protein [Owenweeksia sp.]|nr:ATP-binding protein [Owenweeksia sp.]
MADQILNGMVELRIKDNGVGMTESQIARLFDQNQHFSERGTLNEVGTGLGMLIVFDFVKENNGEILVNSEPGKGSEFIIRFPLAE